MTMKNIHSYQSKNCDKLYFTSIDCERLEIVSSEEEKHNKRR